MAKQAQIDAVRPVLTAIDKDVTAVEGVLDAVVSGADKASDVLESGLEKAADVVPEALDKGVHVTVDGTRKFVRAFRNPRTTAYVVIGASLAAGAGLGLLAHHLMKKRLEKQYQDRLERELEEMRIFYLRRAKAGEFSTPRTAAEALLAKEAVDALDEYQGNVAKGEEESTKTLPNRIDKALREPTRYDKVVRDSEAAEAVREQVTTVEETVTSNIFVDGKALVPDDWDAEAEEAQRNPEVPYVISHDEFMENTYEHEQSSLTYYSGDDVLTDEKDEMIQNADEIVGVTNLGRFGEGSRDPNIVYVRNERTESDYEIALNQGTFAEQVMGGFRHSDQPHRLMRARWGDDE